MCPLHNMRYCCLWTYLVFVIFGANLSPHKICNYSIKTQCEFLLKYTIFAFNLTFLHITEIFSTDHVRFVGDKYEVCLSKYEEDELCEFTCLSRDNRGKCQRDWERNDAQWASFRNSEALIFIWLKFATHCLFQEILDGGERTKSVCENALFGRLELIISIYPRIKKNYQHWIRKGVLNSKDIIRSFLLLSSFCLIYFDN